MTFGAPRYRKLAKKMHPDKNGGTESAKNRFQAMKERYEALKKKIEEKVEKESKSEMSDGGSGDESPKNKKEKEAPKEVECVHSSFS